MWLENHFNYVHMSLENYLDFLKLIDKDNVDFEITDLMIKLDLNFIPNYDKEDFEYYFSDYNKIDFHKKTYYVISLKINSGGRLNVNSSLIIDVEENRIVQNIEDIIGLYTYCVWDENGNLTNINRQWKPIDFNNDSLWALMAGGLDYIDAKWFIQLREEGYEIKSYNYLKDELYGFNRFLSKNNI